MKSFFSVQPKLKVTIVLLVMITMLLSGVLLERHFFQRVDTTSTALYEDRLMPATFVYQLADFIHQRYRVVEKIHITQQAEPRAEQFAEIDDYRRRMDSVVSAFEQTYLVRDESACLGRLKTDLLAYERVEEAMLTTGTNSGNLHRLEGHLDAIRAELLQLSSIQTTVGRELLTDTEHVVANAYALGKFQISILIICCLIALVLVLSAKAVRSPIVQKPNLN